MQKKNIVSFIIIVLISAGITFYVATNIYEETSTNKAILALMQYHLEHDGEVVIADTTPFAWDKVCFFTKADSAPYSAFDAYKSRVGSDPKQLRWRRDYASIVAFFDGNALVKHIATNRALFNISDGSFGWKYDGEHTRKIVYCGPEGTKLSLGDYDRFKLVDIITK